MAQVPTVCVAHLTPAQARAYMLADNRIAQNAGWNLDLLTAEIKELSFNLDFDPTLTGFPTFGAWADAAPRCLGSTRVP